MTAIEAVFRPGHKALIGYLTVGYPDVQTTLEAARTLAAGGVDIIELGIPFSDPLADGATIQKTSFAALEHGVTPEICLKTAAELHRQIGTPLVFMTYYNPVYSFGLEAFCQSCHEAGVIGLIVPDLPPEEGQDLETAARQYSLDLIYLLAPTSTDERIATVAAKSQGFIYLVSLAGVTGARQNLPPGLAAFVQRVRRETARPLCIGFGVSTPEQAEDMARLADGVIVGSRLLQLIEEDKTLGSLKSFAAALREALDRAAGLK